jgi:type IV secretory pathway VirD2 relaxase
MTFENPSLESRIVELQEINSSLQQLVLAQTETIKTQNQTIQNQNNQIQGMQTQLMTVVQMAQDRSRSALVPENFPDNWEEPQVIEEEEDELDPIQFPDLEGFITTTESSEQPAIIGDDNGND